MSELEIIKSFSKIKIKDICKKLNIDSSNLWRGNTSKRNIEKVLEEIIKESLFIILLFENRLGENNDENDTL